MKNITTLGIDLAKNFFQLHGIDANGRAILKRRVTRDNLPKVIAKLKPCNIFMEACGGANYWARSFMEFGHKVRLISPQYVKPFVITNKNDANDAKAIVEAGLRPSMRFVNIKTTRQQDIQATHRIRQSLVERRTELSNELRGILMEYGIFINKGISHVRKEFPAIISEDNKLSEAVKIGLKALYEELISLDGRIKRHDEELEQISANDENCKRLITIPGVGTLTSTILSCALGDGQHFKNGRHFAAYLGLVPRQHSSGGKIRLGRISKRGDSYIRYLLIHGARAVIAHVEKKQDRSSCWVKKVAARRGRNKTAVALANKMARIAWALVRHNDTYKVNHVHLEKKLV
jgi:transposase